MRANLFTFRGLLSEAAAVNNSTLTNEIAAVKTSVTQRYNALCKQGKPFALYSEIARALHARIDAAAGRMDMAAAFKAMADGQAIAFRGRFSDRTGRRLFTRGAPIPLFPGDEPFIKGLAKKAVKKGAFCTLKKTGATSYVQTVYEVAQQGDTLAAKRVSCTVLRGASDAAYISGVKVALTNVLFK